jgi:hypothetical protein
LLTAARKRLPQRAPICVAPLEIADRRSRGSTDIYESGGGRGIRTHGLTDRQVSHQKLFLTRRRVFEKSPIFSSHFLVISSQKNAVFGSLWFVKLR